MGMARESFGTGGGVALAPPPGLGSPPDGTGDGSGAAADGFSGDSSRVTNHVGALADHDAVGHSGLAAAITSSSASRGRMDAVIGAAIADVQASGVAVNTPAGQQALVAAIKRHLQETKSTLDQGSGDAATHAAAANVTAAGYQGIGNPQGGPAPMMPMMPQMPSLPMGGGMPLGGAMLAPLSSLSSLGSLLGGAGQGLSPQSATLAGPTGASTAGEANATPAAAISTDEVNLKKAGFPAGPDAYRGYIGKTLDLMGITDPVARANWTRGLMTGIGRESTFHPDAVNLGDSNARGPRMVDGAPAGASRGGMQTIPATFAANHQPGTSRDIYDPIANLAAGMNYLMRRYHVARDGSNLSAVGQFNPHHAPGGY
ncbi:transglycosylase SLT domain-containing protein [Mycobacterium avium]|uniref:transglycosylase SLT domain-containing protein n=1 Tax=Mycobacterium avium TaxID=1764 RepID=UPI00211BA50E|nr:transglycosylase SLT domain-containing protein [Mycobacterium avium]